VLGWGSLAVLIRRKLHEPDPPRFELFDAWILRFRARPACLRI
jgi:hypothetical protein